MRLPFLIPLLALFNVVHSIDFVNPGPAGVDSDYALNPSFAYGSSIDIQWTPTNDTISLVIYQQTQNAAFEYVFQNKHGLSHYDWDITTSKSLAVSRIFFFEIFIKDETGPTATSHYFNVTGNPPDTASSSTSQSTPQTANPTTAGTALTSASTGAPAASTTSASATPTPSPNSDGLSLGAKVAIGVAIPVAAIAGVLAGWFFFGRKRRAKKQEEQNQQNQQNDTQWHPAMQSYYKPQSEVYAHYKQPPGEMESPHHGPVHHPQELASSPLHSPAELATERHK